MNNESKEKLINDIIQEIDKLNTLPNIEEENFKMGYRKAIYDTTYLYETLREEIERQNKTLEDIDTYIHLWKLEEIGEKTMLILNDILLIKNGMSDEVVRLKDSDKE